MSMPSPSRSCATRIGSLMRGNALPFLPLRLFDHHPRVARFQLRDPRSPRRLLVAPPMFFHAPVYRHLVGRDFRAPRRRDIADGDVFVSNHPYDGGLPHVSDMAFVAPIIAARRSSRSPARSRTRPMSAAPIAGSTSANATEMFQEGLLLPPMKIVSRGVDKDDIERIILANSRQPELVAGDIHAQIAVTQMGASRVRNLRAIRRYSDHRCLRGHPQGRGRRIARGHRHVAGRRSVRRRSARQRWGRARPADATCRHGAVKSGGELRLLEQRPAGPRPGQPAAVHGRSLRVLFAHRLPRAEPAFQRRHARRRAVHLRASHRDQRRGAGAGLQLTRWSISNWSTSFSKRSRIFIRPGRSPMPARASAMPIAWARAGPDSRPCNTRSWARPMAGERAMTAPPPPPPT